MESKLSKIKSNQVLEVDYASAQRGSNSVAILTLKSSPKFLTEVADEIGISFIHQEVDKIDFNVQRTLPHKLTQFGPALAVGDLDGNGLEDLVVGSSSGFAPVWYAQQEGGKFIQKELLPGENSIFEETGILLFDLDNDGDLDLYLVSGSSEFLPDAAEYLDRIYLNDGKCQFTLDKTFSAVKANGSAVRGADFDGDGFMDLFVGGRSPIGKFPLAEKSFLLRNINGRLTDVTDQIAPELRNVGMVTDAVWSDVDGDGKVDLIVVGELMPITIFMNKGDKFEKLQDTGFEKYLGWWNSIATADFDQDGDSDFVVGNLGANNAHHPTFERPVKVYAKDFDNNGSVDPVTFAYYKDKQGGTYNSFPSHFWDDLNGQSPMFRRKFDRYKYFALSTEASFFTEEEKKDVVILTGNYDRTIWAENLGNGKFKVHELPTIAQIAPTYGVVTDDINGDGFSDILMVGNDYGNEIFIGRLDASVGLLLLGDGKGNFEPVNARDSGFVVPGDAKALVKVGFSQGAPLYFASQNRGKLLTFKSTYQEAKTLSFGQEAWHSFSNLKMENGSALI
ncbi:FG-GAP-like repeat-containing protein [Algoriphagus boritolerans]|uniref:FG-GAP-like repeat-containing protein n=1 Tax=Algoriphagus boritolerans TaxID=308111 RepID=UPI002FCE0A57